MRKVLAAALTLAVAVAGTSALAQGRGNAGTKLAWFQRHTIFHSGLVGSHTVALTFDDGPNRHTLEVLAVLKNYDIKATFFIVGRMARANPRVLDEIAAQGHLLANHSNTHPFMGSSYDADPQKLIEQVKPVNNEITPLMPRDTQLFFRAPFGAWRFAHATILNADPTLKRYIGPIYWDVGGEIRMDAQGYVMSSADWECWHKRWPAQVCAKGYLREIRRENGGVVLMHCIHSQSGALVADVVPALIEEGYRFVRLDQVPAYDKYKTPPEKAPLVAVADAGDTGNAPEQGWPASVLPY